MCGISGIVTPLHETPKEDVLLACAQALAHRGPDGEGIWRAPGVGLVHRRLAIIDLAPTGAQPMSDASGAFTIVFNGEIYNYRELKAELSARGVTWKSESDTEVILEGYRAWGDEVVTKLRGMFAFALWDATRSRLLVARDRIGKKPLFYTEVDGALAFASEIKALAAFRLLEPDPESVRLFLGLQYVPTPRTGFRGVFQVPPGHIGVWENGTFAVRSYHAWQRKVEDGMTTADMDARIRELLEEAVRIRQLASDVPVGAFLSSGIDSAAVVAYAARHMSRPLETFTMGFGVSEMDERDGARQLARAFGTNHHEFEARPEDLLALVDTLVAHYDAPYADSSALPVWLLARETAKSIKVVLTGDGGDELFGGYRRYAVYESALRAMTMPLVPSVLPVLASRWGTLMHDPRYERMAGTVEALKLRPETAYGELFCGSYFNSKGLGELLTPEFAQATNATDAVMYVGTQMANDSSLDAAMFFDLTSYLPDDLNVKMDRATMAFGLEARAPFLDQEMVAYALTMPRGQKVSSRETKIALRRALKGVVPDAALTRAKKGFQVPLAEWFRGPLRSLFVERCLSDGSSLRGVCRREGIERLLDENDRGADHGNRLWMVLTLATWLAHHPF